MKFKLFLLTILILLSFISYSQDADFMNIKNGESVSSTISKFIQKGFSFSTDKELQTDTSKTNYAILFGGVGDEKVMLHIYFEQTSRIVYGMNVTLLGFKNWYKLKTFYLEYLNKLKTKYGKPTEEVAKFVLPYVDGFGNEIDGVKNGKCMFGASWASKRLSITITESTNIMIQYGWYEGSLAEALDFKRNVKAPIIEISDNINFNKDYNNSTGELKIQGKLVSDGSLKIKGCDLVWDTISNPKKGLVARLSVSKTPDFVGRRIENSESFDLIALVDPETDYYIRAWAENEKGLAYSNEIKVRVPFQYTIGDQYLGGTIAYILNPEDPGYDATITHGIIVANFSNGELQNSIEWSETPSDSLNYGTEYSLASGNRNTINIKKINALNSTAASFCSQLKINDFADWSLPSIGDLFNIFPYLQRKNLLIGSGRAGYFWSSSQIQDSLSFAYAYNSGWHTGTDRYAANGTSTITHKEYKVKIQNEDDNAENEGAGTFIARGLKLNEKCHVIAVRYF